MASQSRGALIALVVGVIALAFSRSRKTGLIALLLGGALAVVAIPLLIELRLAQDAGLDVISAVERQGASDGYRLHALEAGAQAFLTSPLFGVGLFRYTLETGFYPHNWFMRIISEQGLVGLTLAIGILVLAYRRFRSLSTLPRSIAMGLLAYAVAGGFFHEPLANIQSLVALLFMFTIVVAADWSKGADGRPAPITAPRGSI
jgi:O-antigen ligase